MRNYFSKTPAIVKPLFKDLLWQVQTEEKKLYLTFDDGPVEGITNFVLDILQSHQAKATFFCVGENVAKFPELYSRILTEGHVVGNHTYNHLKGWSTNDLAYYRNVLECAQVVESNLFRPPYGKFTKSQSAAIRKRFKVVMWDVLSRDYDAKTSKEQCLKNVIDNVENGSIVVLHDSLKAKENCIYILPLLLNQLQDEGYEFEVLT